MTKDLPASPDWRGLCEELLDELLARPLIPDRALIDRARALLAQPEPERVGLSDEELLELYRGPGTFSPVEFARAAIAADRARCGRPAPAPAGEVAKLVQPPGRVGLTWQGVIDGLRDVLNDESEDAIQRVWQRSRILDAISVMEANPCPAPAPVEAEVAELALKELERTMVLLMPVTGKNKIKRFDTIRAALKRLHELENKADLSPAPPAPKPADGEVGELVADLRMMASQAAEACQFTDAENLSRAAALLEQRHPAPVPVAERLPGPGDCDAEGEVLDL